MSPSAPLLLLLTPALLLAQGGQSIEARQAAVELTCPPTQWSMWWELNGPALMRVREHALRPQELPEFIDYGRRRSMEQDLLAPTAEQLEGEILPALKKALDSTSQRDITCAVMLAMAKIGRNHSDFRLIDVFAPRLRVTDQEVRETAALSIGLAGIVEEAELQLLTGLAFDNERGRAATGGKVGPRTRAFATYGLGLLAREARVIQANVLASLCSLLEDDAVTSRDIRVAAIHGLSLLRFDLSEDAGRILQARALATLEALYLRESGPAQQLVQAHCPTAIARLIGRDHDRAAYFKELFAADLRQRGDSSRSDDIARSCALALGQLAKPFDEPDDKAAPENRLSRLLLDTYRTHRDQQARYFAILALGQIGGDLNRLALLREFDKSEHAEEMGWVALSLGICAASRGPDSQPDATIAQVLGDAFVEHKDPDLLSSLAIALGLARATEFAPQMIARLDASAAKEELAGALCVGLALMDHQRAIAAVQTALDRATRRPQLLEQAASALAILGDKTVGDRLLQRAAANERNNIASFAAIMSSLRLVGDCRHVAPLAKMLQDERLSDLQRAFAAVALGGIADKERLPWNRGLAGNLNYRATVETLWNHRDGVLDIL